MKNLVLKLSALGVMVCSSGAYANQTLPFLGGDQPSEINLQKSFLNADEDIDSIDFGNFVVIRGSDFEQYHTSEADVRSRLKSKTGKTMVFVVRDGRKAILVDDEMFEATRDVMDHYIATGEWWDRCSTAALQCGLTVIGSAGGGALGGGLAGGPWGAVGGGIFGGATGYGSSSQCTYWTDNC